MAYCLLLIFGIPAAGKSLLAQNIPQVADNEWIWLVIHFDDFYPPDTRYKTVSYSMRTVVLPHYTFLMGLGGRGWFWGAV